MIGILEKLQIFYFFNKKLSIYGYYSQEVMASILDSELGSQQLQINLLNQDVQESDGKQQIYQGNFSHISSVCTDQKKFFKRDKKGLQKSEVQALFNKKDNLCKFIEQIGEYSSHPIRYDIIQHCQKVSINMPNILTNLTLLKLVKNRVEKMIKNKRIKKNWSQQDLKILIWVISKYCQYHGISNVKDGMTEADWNNVAELIPGVTGKSCMFKWLSLKKNNLADNSWVEEQSLLLDQIVKKYGQNSWCKVSEQLFLRNTNQNKIYRCPKQCRQHWNCYLNPILKKGPWEKKEDYLLLRAVMQLRGTKKWAQIVKMFNGRTQNALKNRFNLIVQKQIKQSKKNKKPTQIEAIQNYLKKYENIYQIDQKILKILEEKRKNMNYNLIKKQPKKLRAKKLKQQNQLKNQEQYMPDFKIQKETKSRRCKLKTTSDQQQEIYHQKKKCKNDSVVVSNFSMKKNQEIYQDNISQSIKLQYKQPAQQQRPTTTTIYNFNKSDHVVETAKIFIVPLTEQMLNNFATKGNFLVPCKFQKDKLFCLQ